jgi:hypothetical protein
VTDSQNSGPIDTVVNFDPAHDAFVFAPGLLKADHLDFIGSNAFDGMGVGAEARVQDFGGGQQLLQIDVNGDGQFDANDIAINLQNFNGTLNQSHFLIG